MNKASAEVIASFIAKQIHENFKVKFINKPNTIENRKLLKDSINGVIQLALNGVGIDKVPIDTVVSGDKNELKIYFINKETGEVLENIDELEELLKTM